MPFFISNWAIFLDSTLEKSCVGAFNQDCTKKRYLPQTGVYFNTAEWEMLSKNFLISTFI